MIRDGLRMCWQVALRPTLAFTTIRDEYRKYFPFSIGLLLLMIILYALLLQINTSGTRSEIIENLGWAALGVIAYIGVVYLAGIVWGGNLDWWIVLTVMSYTYAAAIVAALVLVPAILLATIIFGYYTMVILMIAKAVWLAIINIKAVKVVNGFGTAKAFAIVVLAFVASYALPLTSYFT